MYLSLENTHLYGSNLASHVRISGGSCHNYAADDDLLETVKVPSHRGIYVFTLRNRNTIYSWSKTCSLSKTAFSHTEKVQKLYNICTIETAYLESRDVQQSGEQCRVITQRFSLSFGGVLVITFLISFTSFSSSSSKYDVIVVEINTCT